MNEIFLELEKRLVPGTTKHKYRWAQLLHLLHKMLLRYKVYANPVFPIGVNSLIEGNWFSSTCFFGFLLFLVSLMSPSVTSQAKELVFSSLS